MLDYDGNYDEEGESTESFHYCLNCGFNFPYYASFEKDKKKAEGETGLGTGFIFLVLMLFTVIVIKGEQEGRFFNNDELATTQSEESPSPRVDTFSPEPAASEPDSIRILNNAEPFEVGDRN